MKHYKVVNKQSNKEVWRGVADSKYEAHERAYMKMIFEITERKNLIVKVLSNRKLNKF